MIPALARFVEALRREGIHASPAEIVDAATAAERVGPDDRDRFRTALRATLAKTRRQHAAFDRVFDAFFAPPRRGRAGRRESESAAGAGGTGGRGDAGTRPSPTPRPERSESRRSSGPAHDRATRPRAAKPRVEKAERMRRVLEAAGKGGPDRSGRLRKVRASRSRAGDERARTAPATAATQRDLTRPMPTGEERAIAEEIPRLVQTLRLRPGRRLRRARSGRLWTRQIFRENLSRGGVPFVLPFRRPRPRSPEVVLLVDVSYSAARAAGFFLWMAAAFLRLGRRTRVVFFVDRPVDATRAVRGWIEGRVGASRPGGDPGGARPAHRIGAIRPRGKPGGGIAPAGVSFAEMLASVKGLDPNAPSDYGRTFHALLESHLRPAGRDTVLVVLGDGRTNRFDPLPWALEEISRRCRTILWLVPEPRGRWGTADSALADYLPFADAAVEAWDLNGLSRGLAELLRSL